MALDAASIDARKMDLPSLREDTFLSLSFVPPVRNKLLPGSPASVAVTSGIKAKELILGDHLLLHCLMDPTVCPTLDTLI